MPVTGAPRGSRQACTADDVTCAGSCDGTTNDRCAYPGATVKCRPGKCANNLADLAGFCQGNGACAPLQQQSCDLFGCDVAGVGCAGNCKTDADCTAAQYCSAGVCVADLTNGVTCSASTQCTSGHCVDGVCCDTTCLGDCQACDQVGHIGTCTAVVGAPRSGRPGCPGSGSCGGFCDGSSGTVCALPGGDTRCGVAFCASGVLTKAPTCNGAATCILPSAASCDPYQCDANGKSCLTSCQADQDCASGLVCSNGACAQPTPDAGTGPVTPTPDASVGAGGSDMGGSGGATSSTGGKTAAGGATGAAGKGTGGSTSPPGSGGADAGLAGAPDSGKSPGQNGSHDSGGCGCRVGGESGDSDRGRALLAVAALGLLVARRRRAASRTFSRTG